MCARLIYSNNSRRGLAFPLHNLYHEFVQTISVSIGDIIEVSTERMAYGGEAIARYQGLVVFIPFAAPQEVLRVRITELKKNYARAIVEEIVSPSPVRRSAPCPHFGTCGGCQLQHLSYPAQLEVKAGFISDSLARVGGIDWPREIAVRSAAEFGYRARAQIKVQSSAPGHRPAYRRIGFNNAGSRSVCDVEQCPILVPELNAALISLRSAVLSSNGDLREVEMAAGDSGVSFEPALANLPSAPVERVINGARYRFSPSTFFQANPLLLEGLVAEAVEGRAGRTAVDLYAGAGLFALQLAKRFNRVVGVESDRRASEFALRNADQNGVRNLEFVTATAESWLGPYLKSKANAIDLVLLDPPRGGASQVVAALVEAPPPKLVYVSCDPVTLARDLKKLLGGGYQIEDIIAFDLFPQTYHIETVVKLTQSLADSGTAS